MRRMNEEVKYCEKDTKCENKIMNEIGFFIFQHLQRGGGGCTYIFIKLYKSANFV